MREKKLFKSCRFEKQKKCAFRLLWHRFDKLSSIYRNFSRKYKHIISYPSPQFYRFDSNFNLDFFFLIKYPPRFYNFTDCQKSHHPWFFWIFYEQPALNATVSSRPPPPILIMMRIHKWGRTWNIFSLYEQLSVSIHRKMNLCDRKARCVQWKLEIGGRSTKELISAEPDLWTELLPSFF